MVGLRSRRNLQPGEVKFFRAMVPARARRMRERPPPPPRSRQRARIPYNYGFTQAARASRHRPPLPGLPLSAIPILYSFARSGGTLVNQLLGVHPQCLVLSEVNPAASYKPVPEQAVEWLGLVEAGEADEFAHRPYHRQIAELDRRAAKAGKRLVVRDWVTVNFLPGTAGEATVPSGQLEQALYLEHAGMRPVPIVVTRRSATVYRSIKSHFPHLEDLQPEVFANAYLAFARAVAGFPRVHLESLRARPQAAVAEILSAFELDASPGEALLANFHAFQNCTGNTTLQMRSGSATAQRILPPESDAPDDAALAGRHPQLAEADRLMGYG